MVYYEITKLVKVRCQKRRKHKTLFLADPHQTHFSSSSKCVEPLSRKVISYLGTTLEPDSSSAPLADLLPADLCCAASMFRGSTKFVGPSKEVGLSKWSPFSSWDMFSTSPCSVPKIDSGSIGFIERGGGLLPKEIGEPLHFIELLPRLSQIFLVGNHCIPLCIQKVHIF